MRRLAKAIIRLSLDGIEASEQLDELDAVQRECTRRRRANRQAPVNTEKAS